MGEAGRKLTIRMPDRDRLSSAEVAALHVEPGERAPVGAPVMTLRVRRSEQVVRAPRPGRIVPLVAPGDRVRGGDPLYVLNIDEAALAQHNLNARALIATERARWSADAGAEQVEVLRRPPASPPGRTGRIVALWWGPVLAIAFYVAACFAFLPVLSAASVQASVPGRMALLAAVALLGALIVRLYAPRFPGTPRSLVKLVAISWFGVATFAVLHRAEAPDDLTLRASERVVGLFRQDAGPADRAIAVAEPAAMPPAPESPGVYAGASDAAAPRWAEPRTRLAAQSQASPEAPGVAVRPWGRQNPVMRSGEPPQHAPEDMPVGPGAAPAATAAAWPEPLFGAGPAGAPPPPALRPPERVGDTNASVAAIDPMTQPLDEGPPRSPVLADRAPARAPAASPDRGAAPGAMARLPATGADWLAAGVPVIAGEGLPAREIAGGAIRRGGPPLGLERPTALVRPDMARRPGPVLAAAPRVAQPETEFAAAGYPALALADVDPISEATLSFGLSEWMRARDLPAEDTPVTGTGPAAPGARSQAPDRLAPAADREPGVVPSPSRPPLLVSSPEQPPASRPTDAAASEARSAAIDMAALQPLPERMRGAPATVAPPARALPPRDPLPPDPPQAPAVEPAVERQLLFVYYDDPRLQAHPRAGEQWLPAVSPAAAAAIRSARVEAVREIVEVTDWCSADKPVAALSDRIRLLQVRMDVDPGGIGSLEAELPVLSGAAPGLFHNRAPLLGGDRAAPLMLQARDFLGVSDEGAPEGRYFDSGAALAGALEAAGCRRIEFNGGAGPANGIGRDLARHLAG